MIFSKTTPYIIIGETSTLYVHGTKHQLLQNPKDITALYIPSPLIIYTDFPGATYSTHPYPKLSRFEVRAAIQNHPTLQEKDLLSASAKMTQKGDLNLCTLKNNDLLNTWLETLAQKKIPLKSIAPFPFYQKFQTPSKALYTITRTHNNRARHTCIIEDSIVFVRYTDLDKNIEAEIIKTSQFIQRDYALERDDIHMENRVHSKEIPTSLSTHKIFYWQWIEHLPKELSQTFKDLKKAHQLKKMTQGVRITSIGLFGGALFFFLNTLLGYFSATSIEKSIIQSMAHFPPALQNLSLEKRQNIVWLDHNFPTPFNILNTLQKQGETSLKLEEFHWQQLSGTTQRMRLSIKHHQQQRQQERKNHLKILFNTPIKVLPSDGHVDRFELTLMKKGRV